MKQFPISVCVGSIRPDTVGATVAAIRSQTWQEWELVLVAQGRDYPADTLDRLAGTDRRVRIVRDAGKGASRARNVAIAAARHPLLAFTDDDCAPPPDWLGKIAARFSADPELGVLGGALLPGPRRQRTVATCPQVLPMELVHRPGDDPPPPSFAWLSANFAVTAEAAARIGGFDELLGTGALFRGGEELDFKLRAEKAGVVQATTPDLVVVHEYGWRYGVRRTWRLLADYAYSTGAVAGKLHLAGDPGGEAWRRNVHLEVRQRLVPRRSPTALPRTLLRWRSFEAGYRDVVNGYQVDPASNLLKPRSTGAAL